MSAPPFMPLYVADYLSDTRHLTTEQHGAYLLLLMAMWRAGGRLPRDPAKLARICGVAQARWSRIEPDLVALFEPDGEAITHPRVVKELGRSARLSEERAAIGARGGHAKALKTRAAAMANAIDLPAPEPGKAVPSETSDIRQEKDADASSPSPAAGGGKAKESYPEAFEACWRSYPHIRGRSSKTRSFTAWRRMPAETRAALADAIGRYAAQGREPKAQCGAPAMDRWLRDARYLDWLAEGASAGAPAVVFEGPLEVREAVVVRCGEAWARSWLDRCGWDPGRRTLLAANGLAAERLEQEVGALLRRLDVKIGRRS